MNTPDQRRSRLAGTLPVGEKASRRDIQGLRGVAVILVLLAHAGVPGFEGGFLGVDIFFVLSGFLITGLLVREVATTGSVSIARFYARRARRILPAATVVLVATVLAATLLLPFVEADRVGRDALWAAFFAANIHYAVEGTDYFAGDLSPSAFQHFWSLAVEEQFYIVWPLVVLALAWVAARRRRSAPAGVVAVVAGVAVLVSFAWSIHATASSPATAYFSTFARAWELGLGALLACVALPVARRLTRTRREVLAAAGLAGIVLGLLFVDPRTPWPGWWAALPVVGTVLLLAAGLPQADSVVGRSAEVPDPTRTSRLVEVGPVRWVGDISYSLYLWHWPLLVIVPAWLGRDLTIPEASGLMVVAVPIAALSYYLVENPFRRAGTTDRRARRRALALWPAAMALSFAAVQASSWWVVQQQVSAQDGAAALLSPSAETSSERIAAATDAGDAPEPDPGAEVEEALQLVTADAAQELPIPFPLGQDLLELNADRVQFDDRCTAEPDESSHDLCPAGDTDSDRLVALYGDSHLNMWSPGLDRVAREAGVKVIPFIKFGCTPVEIDIRRADTNRSYTECARWRDWSLQQMERLQPDAVVIGTHTNFYALDADGEVIEGAERDAAWRSGVSSMARALEARAGEVRLIGDLNLLDVGPADCLSRRGATIGDCTFPPSRTVRAMDRLSAEGLEGTGVRLVPLTPMLCVQQRCPIVAADLSVYRDVQHVSASWAEYAAPALWADLDLFSDER